MIEIIVGFIALIVSYHIFPRENSSTNSQETIIPFLEDDWLDEKNHPKSDLYDWGNDIENEFESASDGYFDPPDEYFE
jgi:hypothetical protein